jgi:hypothetical protein
MVQTITNHRFSEIKCLAKRLFSRIVKQQRGMKMELRHKLHPKVTKGRAILRTQLSKLFLKT